VPSVDVYEENMSEGGEMSEQNLTIIQQTNDATDPRPAPKSFLQEIKDKDAERIYFANAVKEGTIEELKEKMQSLRPERLLEILHKRDSKGDTIIHIAASFDQHEKIAELVRDMSPADLMNLLTLKNKNGMTPLLEAIKREKLATAEWILKSTKLPKEVMKDIVIISSKHEVTAVAAATAVEALDLIKCLAEILEERLPNQLLAADLDGNNTLHIAACNGYIEVAEYFMNQLAEKKICVNNILQMENNIEKTPVQYASMNGQDEFVIYLTEKESEVKGVVSNLIVILIRTYAFFKVHLMYNYHFSLFNIVYT